MEQRDFEQDPAHCHTCGWEGDPTQDGTTDYPLECPDPDSACDGGLVCYEDCTEEGLAHLL